MKWNEPVEIVIRALDFDFKKFVTPTIIKIAYALAIVLAFVMTINFVVVGFRSSELAGVIRLLVAIFAYVFYMLILRIILEILIALFRSATAKLPKDENIELTKPEVAEKVEEPESPMAD